MEPTPESENLDWPLLHGLDYDAQFRAIRSLLFRQERVDRELSDKIEEVGEFAAQARGTANERAVDEWVDLLHDSCYQDAAHSMAAVGMIAPFIESVFRQAFQRIGEELPQRNLAKNITARIDRVGMGEYMPDDLKPTLSALFAYRNKMFHNGFEWPVEVRRGFEQRLDTSGWPSEWFSHAAIGGKRWMFYMSPEFIEHCVDRIGQIVEGIERFGLAQTLSKLGVPADQQVIDLDSFS